MEGKRSAAAAELETVQPRDPKTCRPRRGVTPSLAVADGAAEMDRFCKATGAVPFFQMPEEKSGKLMHGCIVTPTDGYIFFEDIATNTFEAKMKVPFEEYRKSHHGHVNLHANVKDATKVASRMQACKLAGPCKVVVPVEKQFWGAEFGIVEDGAGLLWSLSTKSDSEAEASPCPTAVQASVCVPDPNGYLAFLREAFGDDLVEEDVSRDGSGLLIHAELLIAGSGFELDLFSQGDPAADAAKAAGLRSYGSLQVTVPRGQAKKAAATLAENGGAVVSEPSLRFYGKVQGRVRISSGVFLGLCEPALPDGPTKEDIDAYIKIGQEHGWDAVCTIKKLPSTFSRYVGMRTKEEVPLAELPEKLFSWAFDFVKDSVGEEALCGRAVAVYHGVSVEKGTCKVTVGYPVKEGFELSGGSSKNGLDLVAAALPHEAFTCSHTTFEGPFSGLRKAWALLTAWSRARGCELCAPDVVGIEVFTSMANAEGEQPVTELYCPAPSIKDETGKAA